ncbi:protein tyrosine phosphatase, partial [Pseudonocardia hispaniensis]
MAAQVFRAELTRAGLADRVAVISAGTGDWHVGNPADERAVALLRDRGYPVDHVARQ